MLEIPQIGRFQSGEIQPRSCPHSAVRRHSWQKWLILSILLPVSQVHLNPTSEVFRTHLDTALTDLLQLKEKTHIQLPTLQEEVWPNPG